MYDPVAALRSLVLPYGQPANSPQVIINIDPIPALIVAYYAANGAFAAPETVVNIPVIAQKDSSNYVYESLNLDSAGEMYFCHGTVDSVNGVNENWRELVPFGFRTGLMFGALGASGSITQVQFGIAQAQQTCAVDLNLSSSWRIDGVNQPRGLRSHAASQAPTGAIGAETVVATYPSMTFRDNEAYRVTADAAMFGSVANVGLYRWRQTNIAGPVLQVAQHANAGGGVGGEHRFHDEFVLIRTAGSDLTDQIVLTLQSSAGTVTQQASATQVRSFSIWDHGSANDYNAEATI